MKKLLPVKAYCVTDWNTLAFSSLIHSLCLVWEWFGVICVWDAQEPLMTDDTLRFHILHTSPVLLICANYNNFGSFF